MGKYKKKIREYRKSRHPAVICGEGPSRYDFIGLTHGPKNGSKGRNDVRLFPLPDNPDPDDARVCYYRNEYRSDRKKFFKKSPYKNKKTGKAYRLTPADDTELDFFVARKLAKRKKGK